MYKILLVEDEPRVAELLQSGLEESGYKVVVASDGVIGLRLFFQHSFDLVISDIILPKMDGFALCKEIRQVNSLIPILMLTALGSTDDKLEGFDSGADDYLTKPFDFRELLVRISVLLKRSFQKPVQKAETIVYRDLRINKRSQKAYRGEVSIKLSPKEYELLLYMMENADRVLSRKEIMENVWHTSFDPGTNFIDVYINYLRKKIDRDFAVKLIHTRTGFGFIFTDQP